MKTDRSHGQGGPKQPDLVVERTGVSATSAHGNKQKVYSSGQENQVRRDKVERAKRLIADPNYPPLPVLQKVGEKLARKARSWRGAARARNN